MGIKAGLRGVLSGAWGGAGAHRAIILDFRLPLAVVGLGLWILGFGPVLMCATPVTSSKTTS